MIDGFLSPYPWQYVWNENTELSISQHSEFQLKHWHILPASLCGTVYLGDKAIQIFVSSLEMKYGSGTLQFIEYGDPSNVHCISGEIDYEDGVIKLHWNAFVPGDHKLVVSYEYDATRGEIFNSIRK